MNMKKDIFDKTNPFTVPDGYFDSFQERIMNRIQAEKTPEITKRNIQMRPFRLLIAAAACILLIFTGTTLYITYTADHPAVAESLVDDDFYQWFYTSDGATLMAESLDINMPYNILANENNYSEEDEAIIHFLERDNINVMAIVYSVDNDMLINQNSISDHQY